ncbi:MAG: hypothetical protein ACXW1D_01505 [Halobacteriota archaeon]
MSLDAEMALVCLSIACSGTYVGTSPITADRFDAPLFWLASLEALKCDRT